MSLTNREMTVVSESIPPPPLTDILPVIDACLKENYAEVTVEIVECPDLSEAPFHLAAKGICGKNSIADVGGIPYLIPGPAQWNERVYNLDHTAAQANNPGGLILGGGVASKHDLGLVGNTIVNCRTGGGEETRRNETRAMWFDSSAPNEGKLVHYENEFDSADYALFSNFFISEGKSGQVLKVKAKKRTGSEGSIITCMRKALDAAFDVPIGMGGTFLLKSGTALVHILGPESKLLKDAAVVGDWIKFYKINAPMVNMSSFISNHPGLDERFGRNETRTEAAQGHNIEQGLGGHYDHDVTPDDVEYIGYFSLAETIYFIDKPEDTRQIPVRNIG